MGGIVVNSRDITERRELEEMKDGFVSTVSHELRTPLTSIKGYQEMLLEGEAGPLNEEQREYAEVAYRNAARLNMLVEDLLLLSRIQEGKIGMGCEVLDVGRIVREVAEELRPAAGAKGLSLSSSAEPHLTVTGDRLRLAQVLTNLLTNAIKLTPPGRSVETRARWAGGEERLVVEVIDEGVGVPASELPRLTERFFRASTAEGIQGTGLGLAITKEIVERHGGRLEIESEEGAGSTFRIVLPATSQS